MNSILNLSEAASIALHGIILVAKSDSFTNVQKMADELGSSKHHIAKVMQRLTKGGYIDSLRGPKGGFVLKKSPKDITFLEIYELIEGEIIISKCPFGREHTCKFDKCILNNITIKLTKKFKEYMQSQTVEMYLD